MTRCDEFPLPEFLSGELEKAESLRVLAHLEDCRDCSERLQVMAALKALDLEVEVENRPRGYRHHWAVAAAVLLVVVGWVLFRNELQFGPQPSPLAESGRIEPYPQFPLEVRSASEPDEPARIEAFDAYRRGDYGEAEKWFSKCRPDPEIHFYRGVSLALLGRYEMALNTLIGASSEPKWSKAVLWYQANVLLKLNRRAEAIQLLTELSHTKEEYSLEAETLLRELEGQLR